MKLPAFLFFLLFSIGASAQDIAFVVYYAKGKSTVNNSNTSIKKGTQLRLADKILVTQGAQLVLVCRNYQSVKLDSKGTFSVKDLLKKCEKNGNNFTSSYFSYVWNELTHPHGSPEAEPTHYMRNTGSVSRGCASMEYKLPVDTIVYAQGQLPLFFKTTSATPFFSVFAEPTEGEELIHALVKNNIRLEEWQKSLEPGTYYWNLTESDGSGCERNVLQVLSKEDYRNLINRISKDLPLSSPAETAFMRGFLLEENHLLADAFIYYQMANRFQPENKIYKTVLSRFYE